MSFVRDLKTLFHLTLAPIRGDTHQARLDSFYRPQAADYDRIRKRMLHGKQELYDRLPSPEDGVWIELGGGTGANLEYLGDRRRALKRIHLVDLSTSLLAVARARIAANSWDNVIVHEADATDLNLPEKADVVTLSYSLTMMSDWYLALDAARRLLKPNGWIGVVDFYVSRKHPAPGHCRHSWPVRTFWPMWFAGDNVFPSPDHVPYLHSHFTPVHFAERRARVAYVPLLTTPYYVFVGRNRE